MKTARGKDNKQINKKFFDKWAESYDNFIFGWWMWYIQRRVLEEIKIRLRTSVLDIGCGTGHMLFQLANTIKKGKIVGIDLSGEMIKQALLKTKKIKNITLKKADVEKIPYPMKHLIMFLQLKHFTIFKTVTLQ